METVIDTVLTVVLILLGIGMQVCLLMMAYYAGQIKEGIRILAELQKDK